MVPVIPPALVGPDAPRPFWSVVIPTYRPREAFLRETLESILQQDAGMDQMQIEVVDDCSPNVNVAQIVESIAGARVKVSRTSKNLGAAGCFNTGIERAVGQWVHILHQDDYVLPGFYRRMRSVAEQHPGVAFVASRTFNVDEQGIILGVSPRVRKLEAGGRAVECFFYGNPIQCPGLVMRRKFYEVHGGFRPDMVFVVDVEMWARAVGLEGGVIIPEVLACFRANSQTTSRLERTGDSLRDVEHLIQIYAERYPNFDPRRSLRQLCEKTLEQARRFSRMGETQAAKASWDYWKKTFPASMRLLAFGNRLALAAAKRLSSDKPESNE